MHSRVRVDAFSMFRLRSYQRKALALMALGRKEEAMEAAREGLKFDSSFAPLMEILQNK